MKIKVTSPSDASPNHHLAKLWQDYWVKLDLEKEFVDLGYQIVKSQQSADVDIHLFGTWSPHEKFLSAPKKFCWFISHPDKIYEQHWAKFHQHFNHIWVASKAFTPKVKEKSPSCTVSTLLGGTSKQYRGRARKPEYDIVLMGNASKPNRREIVKHLISLNKYNILIAGGGWNKILSDDIEEVTWIPYHNNESYPEFYNKGYVTFFSGHADMVKHGLVPPRIFDVYASSDCVCICETSAGLDDIFREVPQFTHVETLVDLIDRYIIATSASRTISEACREDANKFTFKSVAMQMDNFIKGREDYGIENS